LQQVVVSSSIFPDVSIPSGEVEAAIGEMAEEDEEGSEASHAIKVRGRVEFLGFALLFTYSILDKAGKKGETNTAQRRPPCLYSTCPYAWLDSVHPT
jgi:hypothetical protein